MSQTPETPLDFSGFTPDPDQWADKPFISTPTPEQISYMANRLAQLEIHSRGEQRRVAALSFCSETLDYKTSNVGQFLSDTDKVNKFIETGEFTDESTDSESL